MSNCCDDPLLIYTDHGWSCSNCKNLKGEEKPSWDKNCECGSMKTFGPNNKHHTFWCPLYKKP